MKLKVYGENGYRQDFWIKIDLFSILCSPNFHYFECFEYTCWSWATLMVPDKLLGWALKGKSYARPKPIFTSAQ